MPISICKAVCSLFVEMIAAGAFLALGQTGHNPATAPTQTGETSASGFEFLNVQGTDIQIPPFTESVFGTDNAFRRGLLRRRMALRFLGLLNYTQNVLDDPVPTGLQVYAGERPFGRTMLDPIFTMDLSALHLRETQLNVSAGLQWVNWNPAGPRSAALTSLYLYKGLAEGRAEIKAGYLFNNYEFVGLQVGGTLTSAALGVYAVLPYEAGLSYFPLTTPAFNLKLNGPSHLYLKAGVQRSTDAAGGPATVARNQAGLRFIPRGDKLLSIVEAGYKGAAIRDPFQTWLRGGYMHNSTRFTDSLTGSAGSGNYCAYLLADRQLVRAHAAKTARGVYAGISLMRAPAWFDRYYKYYEGRVYDEGPFRSRPFDTASIIATRSVYSPDFLKPLIAQHRTVWGASNSVTASYTLRAGRGVYITGGLSYITGPALTPRVPNALTATIQSAYFF